MSFIKRVIFVFLLCTPAFAKPYEITQATLPLKFNTGNAAPYGMPSTIITIQGKKIPIVFDTGAKKSEITLSKHALKNIHVKFTGKNICFKAMDGKHCEKEFIIPEVKLGNFVITNVKGTLMTKLWGGNEKGFKVTEASRDGVIGYTLLSKFNILLDYPSSKAVLFKKGHNPANYDVMKWVSTPFIGQFHTKLKLNNTIVNLSWDTGSIPSIIKKSTVNHFSSAPCPTNAPYRKDCESIITQIFTTNENKKLPNTWFMIVDIPPYAPFDGLIGSNFYAKNLVYFDFDDHRIYVNPYKNS